LHARLSSHQLLRDPWFIFNLGSVRCERVFLCGLYLCAGAGVYVMMAIATEQPDIPNNAKWIGFVSFMSPLKLLTSLIFLFTQFAITKY